MSVRRWFARKEHYIKSEAITFDVDAANKLNRRIQGGPPTPLAVTTDIPLSGAFAVNVAIGGNISTVAGSYLNYTGFGANPFGVSAAGDTITITKSGTYYFEPILDIQCGVAPEVPCEVWVQLEIDGVSINNATLHTSGGTNSPSRSLRGVFIHGQGLSVPTLVRFEVQGDSLPNGTPITLTNARVIVGVVGIPAV